MTTTTTPVSPPRFVRGEGARVRRFGERFIVQTKGRWAGRSLVHQAWQRAFLDELFLRRDNGSRVYHEALLGIARKNGKSTTGSEIGLYGLMGTREQSPEVYAAAAAKDQARAVFGQSADFVDASPLLKQWLKPQRNVILCKSNRGVFRVLASDAPLQYGLNPSVVVIDELWAHQQPELYYALTTGQLAREDPLVVSCTTAGFDRDSICFELYERGRNLRDNGGIRAMRDAGFLFWWYEMDAQADYRDESEWKAANPSDWITIEALRAEQARLPESVFRRLHLNQWTETSEAWIKTWEWDACRGRPLYDPSKPTWMAVDVGFRRDSAAITWGQWHGEQLHVGQLILIPAAEGPTFGVSDIRGETARHAALHPALREINFDPWQFQESAEILAERGLPMVEFPQNAMRMAPASETLYELITQQRLVHDGNQELKAQMLAAVAAPTDRGGWRISKRRSVERIDAAVSLAMTADRAVTMRHVKQQRRTIHFA
jgi:phage terminase large subunit-like protein